MTRLSEALQEYRKKKGLSIVELAGDLGVPRQTLDEWLYRDAIPGARYHQLLEVKFPGVFDGEWVMPSPAPRPREVKQILRVDETELKVKIHLATHHITALSELFTWFLFKTTAAERNQFRSLLGRQWEQFTNLAHAMIGEKAFEVIREEGRLMGERRP